MTSAVIVVILVLAGAAFLRWSERDDRRHSAMRIPGCPCGWCPRGDGLPSDGTPLDDYEQRILGRIDMDALITVPEPRYRPACEHREEAL